MIGYDDHQMGKTMTNNLLLSFSLLGLCTTLAVLGCDGDDDDSATDDDDTSVDDDDSAAGDDDDDTGTGDDDDSGTDDDDDSAADDDDSATDDDDDDSATPDPIYVTTELELYTFVPAAPYTLTLVDAYSGYADLHMWDIALDTSGTLLGLDTESLLQVDPATAALATITTLADARNPVLAALSDGRLLVLGNAPLAGFTSWIYVLDPSTGSMTEIAELEGWALGGGAVQLPDGLLYVVMWEWDDDTRYLLRTYDLDLDQWSTVGETGFSAIWGLAYAEQTLFGFTDGGEVLEIDPATGAATLLDSHALEFEGAASPPAGP